MKIESRPETQVPKQKQEWPSTYEPLEMTDQSVYDLAAHLYTQEEIAEIFHTERNNLMSKHGDAFHAGKASIVGPARRLRLQAFKQFEKWCEDTGMTWAHDDAPFARMMRITETIEKQYAPKEDKIEINLNGLQIVPMAKGDESI